MKKQRIISIIIVSIVFFIALFLSLKLNLTNNAYKLKAAVSNTSGEIHFINVGSADAILLKSGSTTCLIDAGTYDDGPKVADYIKSLGVSTLNYVIATHSHWDHIGGIPPVVWKGLINKNTIYYYRPYEKTGDDDNHPEWHNEGYYTDAYRSVAEDAKAKLIDVTNTNTTFSVGDFTIHLLNTESWKEKGNTGTNPTENNNYIVEYVKIGSKTILLTADMEQ